MEAKKKNFLKNEKYTLARAVIYSLYCIGAIGYVIYTIINKDGSLLLLLLAVPLGLIMFPEIIMEIFKKKEEWVTLTYSSLNLFSFFFYFKESIY